MAKEIPTKSYFIKSTDELTEIFVTGLRTYVKTV